MKRRDFIARQLSLALFMDAKLDLGHKRGRAKSASVMNAAQVWNVAGLVLSLIGILLLICVWRVVSHAKQHLREDVDEVGLRLDRIYGVLGWIGFSLRGGRDHCSDRRERPLALAQPRGSSCARARAWCGIPGAAV